MDQSTSANQQQGGSGGNQKKGMSKTRLLLYAIIGIVVIVVLAALFLPSGSSVVITQNSSLNSTQIYMSPSQAQDLLGSTPSNYSTSDIYNTASPFNITALVSAVPQLYGNVTSGWVTVAAGSNAAYNSSLLYIVVTTNNTAHISALVGSAFESFINATESTVTPGTENGLSYTYGTYSNSTLSSQLLYGYKGDNVALLLLQGNTGFSANQSQLIGVAANDTPLH